jgi:hypothetical protein
MTEFSGDSGVARGAGQEHLHHPSGGPRQAGEDGVRFGRGWIPGDRDIGLPGEQAVAGQDFRERKGDGPRIRSSSSSETSCEASGAPGLRGDDDRAAHTAWDASRKVRFLDHLSEKGDVSSACARVGMSRTSAYLLRRRDAAFAAGWQAALVLARAHVEEVLATRALDGTEEAVWFRGEQVGTRRKYDTRLLLAHLARLDRAAEAGEGAQALAGRFDEMLAVVAGERAGLGADGVAAADASAPGALPPARAEYLEASDGPGWIAARGAWIDAVEAIDRAVAGDTGSEEPDYPPAPERADLHRASAARWDGWQSRAFARVDALLAGEMEYKSMDGPGAAGAGEGAGGLALDRVNRVNLTARRRRGAAGQKVSEAGNAGTPSPLSGVKAGAALPPPLPSCAGRHIPPLQIRERPASVLGQFDRTASSTLPLPLPRMPISSAAASDRSITRLPWNGPRSLTVTTTLSPLDGLVT